MYTLLFRINEGSQISIGVRHIPKNDKRRVRNNSRGYYFTGNKRRGLNKRRGQFLYLY